MAKTIEGVKIDPAMSRRRAKRGQVGQDRRKREQVEKELIQGVPNFATKQLERNVKYGEYQKFKNSKDQHQLTSNAPFNGAAKGRQYAALVLSPKKRVRYFLKEELSDKPDNNGRYAVYAGFSLTEPLSTFIAAFINKPAAMTAQLLAYKEGTYLKVNVVDRGPGYNFQTVHQLKRSA